MTMTTEIISNKYLNRIKACRLDLFLQKWNKLEWNKNTTAKTKRQNSPESF